MSKYTLADTEKIEIEAKELREMVGDLSGTNWHQCLTSLIAVQLFAQRMKNKYPAAFEKVEEEWEDVTAEFLVSHAGTYKIEKDSILRLKK